MAYHKPTALDLACMVIKCAVCDKVVDRVQREANIENDKMKFTVCCHGDTDTCELSYQDLENLGAGLEPGYAFTTRRIEDGSGTGRASGESQEVVPVRAEHAQKGDAPGA